MCPSTVLEFPQNHAVPPGAGAIKVCSLRIRALLAGAEPEPARIVALLPVLLLFALGQRAECRRDLTAVNIRAVDKGVSNALMLPQNPAAENLRTFFCKAACQSGVPVDKMGPIRVHTIKT